MYNLERIIPRIKFKFFVSHMDEKQSLISLFLTDDLID